MPLLEPSVLEALERLALATRTRLTGFFSGEHRSRRFGSSVDFADYREYRPGDDFRRIDVALYARLDRLFLKLFEAEEDVPVRVVLDCSASMEAGGKHRLAAQAAAAFAHISLVQADRVRVYAAHEAGAEASRWFRSKAESPAMLGWLEGRTAAGGTGLAATLKRIREESRPGVLVVVSDLLEPEWDAAVRRMAPPGEAAVLHVLAPDELEPPLEGDLTLVDAETGADVEVSVTPASLEAYRARLKAWLDAVRSACTARGIAYAMTRSDADVFDLFARSLRREAVVR